MESNLFGVMFVDLAGRMHGANDYLAHLLGYSHAEIAAGQARWDEFAPPELAALDRQAVEQVTTQGVCTPYEKVFQHKDGRRIPVLIAGAMLQKRPDEAAEIIAIVLDLTELKQVTEERDRFFSLSPDIFAVADLQGSFTYINQACEKLLGLTPQEMTSQPYFNFVHPDDIESTAAAAQQVSEGQSLLNFENRCRHKDGSYRWFEWNVTAIPNDSRVYCTGHDITERKRRETEREQLLQQEQAAREVAERANHIKDEFLAVVSHELRSPLNPILGWSQLLKRGQLSPEKTAQALEIIERNAKLQVQLIGDLLDISRILRGKLSLEKVPTDLNAVISAAIETVRLAAEAKAIEVTTLSSPYTVIGDSGRLQQVIWNLLSNAVKFTPEGGKVTITSTQAEKFVKVTVADTGKGITPEFLPFVFEHFQQEDYSTTRKFGGLGLGLAIAKQLIELHDGTIAVHSDGEGQGASFTIRIPTVASEVSPLAPSAVLAPDLTGQQILIVDDDADSREIAAFTLEQAGATVTAVFSGGAALHAIAQSPPDVLISDIGMPDMDGYMLMQEIRQQPTDQTRPMIAIALTAYAGEIDQQQSLAAGFQRHLTKPIDPDTLIATISELLAASK